MAVVNAVTYYGSKGEKPMMPLPFLSNRGNSTETTPDMSSSHQARPDGFASGWSD